MTIRPKPCFYYILRSLSAPALLPFGELGDEHRGEHERAAYVLPCGHALAEYYRARDGGKYRFKAEKDRDERGVALPLGDYLEQVSDPAREYRDVQQGEYAGAYALRRGAFEKEHPRKGNEPRRNEFRRAEVYGVEPRREAVYEEYLHGEHHGAEEGQKVARGELRLPVYAEEVEACDREREPQPENGTHALSKQQPADGHEHHVKRGYEARFAGVGAEAHARLLEYGGGGERGSAESGGDEEPPAVRGALLLGDGAALPEGAERALDNKKERDRDKEAQRIERHCGDVIRAYVLRDERGAPDQGGYYGEYRLSES